MAYRATVVLLVVSAAVATSASAHPRKNPCAFDAGAATTTLDVTDFPAPSLVARADGRIRAIDWFGEESGDDCGTVTSVDRVILEGRAPRFEPIFLITASVPFAPGATDESGSSDEIEFEAGFRGGPLVIQPGFESTPPASITLGENEINLNAAETDGVDSDVTVDGPHDAFIPATDRPDRIDASGGRGTPPAPFELPVEVNGLNGADVIVGGAGPDLIGGAADDDRVLGGEGGDFAAGDGGDDVVGGGAGRDEVYGGPGDDRILGGTDRDLLIGGNGRDVCIGGPGFDRFGRGCDVSRQ